MLTLIARKFSPEAKKKTSAIGTRPWHFTLAFLIAGFMMKVVGEAVHELLGHGSFVLLFGGQITHFYISLLWPYEFSYVGWSIPSATPGQMTWIIGGGILVSVIVSYSIQILLLRKQIRWQFSVPLFWLSFWCYISSTGYLIISGALPFGDVEELIHLGVLTSSFALMIGTALFLTGFLFLSKILRKTLTIYLKQKTRWWILIFWFVIPVLVGLTMAGRGMFHFLIVLFSFIPILLSYLLEFQIKSKYCVRGSAHDGLSPCCVEFHNLCLVPRARCILRDNSRFKPCTTLSGGLVCLVRLVSRTCGDCTQNRKLVWTHRCSWSR